MISMEVPSETATMESLRETELQEARAIQLAGGDSGVFLSDGLMDATSGAREILGIEEIRELLAACREKAPQEILRSLFPYVEAYAKGQARQDDRLAAVLRYSPST